MVLISNYLSINIYLSQQEIPQEASVLSKFLIGVGSTGVQVMDGFLEQEKRLSGGDH